jgi:hypothetical protein
MQRLGAKPQSLKHLDDVFAELKVTECYNCQLNIGDWRKRAEGERDGLPQFSSFL